MHVVFIFKMFDKQDKENKTNERCATQMNKKPNSQQQ